MLTLDKLNFLITVLKSTKRDIYFITPSMILATEKSYVTLTSSEFYTGLTNCYLLSSENLKGISDAANECPQEDYEKLFEPYLKIYGSNNLIDKYVKINTILSNHNTVNRVYRKDARENEDIKLALESKIKDGYNRIVIPSLNPNSRILFGIVNGLIPAVKKDSIHLSMYSNSSLLPLSYIGHFEIDKKAYILDLYVEYLKME